MKLNCPRWGFILSICYFVVRDSMNVQHKSLLNTCCRWHRLLWRQRKSLCRRSCQGIDQIQRHAGSVCSSIYQIMCRPSVWTLHKENNEPIPEPSPIDEWTVAYRFGVWECNVEEDYWSSCMDWIIVFNVETSWTFLNIRRDGLLSLSETSKINNCGCVR